MDETKTMQATAQPAEELNLVLNDHKISVPVKNQFGEQIGVFRFDPTDFGIVDRYNDALPKFEAAINGINKADGMNALDEAGEKIIELFDTIFGGNSREAFFAKTHPLSPQDGKFYAEGVLEAVGAFIVKKFDAEATKFNARIATQTHGYRSGKHAKGKK